MSSILYIASDAPLAARPNPHDRMASVNEALAMGYTHIPAHLLADSFDRDLPEVLLISDREVNINVDTGVVEDGGHDDDFSVWLCPKQPGMHTNKAFCAVFEWHRFTPGRANEFIRYLERQLDQSPEIELWHAWLDDREDHQTEITCRPIDQLTAEDIHLLEETDIYRLPPTDYCFLITRPCI